MAYTIHDEFYIPLVDVTIDLDRLHAEVTKYVAPVQNDYGLTCLSEDVNNNIFDFQKYSGLRKDIKSNIMLLPTGHIETDVIHWPRLLQGSYIQQIGIMLADYLNLTPPRCRLSYFNNRAEKASVPFHNDTHTPYRVHIVLETTTECKWRYRRKVGEEEYSLHQPVSIHPVLINTADIQHSIEIPKYNNRMHLWYQFHSRPDQKFIDTLIEKYKSIIN